MTLEAEVGKQASAESCRSERDIATVRLTATARMVFEAMLHPEDGGIFQPVFPPGEETVTGKPLTLSEHKDTLVAEAIKAGLSNAQIEDIFARAWYEISSETI